MKTLWLLTLFTALSLLATGCLSDSYRIPDRELERLVDLPPQQRGDRVRVLQRLGTEREVDSSSSGGTYARISHPHCHNHGVSVGYRVTTVSRSGGTRLAKGPGRVSLSGGKGTVRAAAPNSVASGRGTVRAPAPSAESTPQVAGGPSTPTGNAEAAGGGKPADAPSGGSSSGGGLSGFDDLRVILVVVVAAAVVVTVGAMATEGMRYDGWIQVEPDHVVRFVDGSGNTKTVRLSDLGHEHLNLGEAVLLEDDGAIDWLDRAPLNRVGFVWRMEGGMTQLPATDEVNAIAGGANLQFGYFPLQSLGILASTFLAFGSHEGTDLLGIIYGLELDFIPLRFGPLHLGVYGAGTMGLHVADRAQDGVFHDVGAQTGLLAEFDLTTRLAFSLRGGVQFQRNGDDWLSPMFVTTAGFSVY